MNNQVLPYVAGIGTAWFAGSLIPVFMAMEEGRPITFMSVVVVGAVVGAVSPIGWLPGLFAFGLVRTSMEQREAKDVYTASLEREVEALRKKPSTDAGDPEGEQPQS